MPVTLRDIADRANVTTATVSMVINNKPNISDETRQRVMTIARELNYYPNSIARSLAISKSNSVGVIVPNLASSYVVRILQGIKSTNRDIEYTVQLFDTIGQKESEAQLFQRLARERRIDGAILVDPVCSEDEMRVFKDEMVPCVVVARRTTFLDTVFVDNLEAARSATQYLLGKNHRDIACVICRKTNLPWEDRVEGYRYALTDSGIQANDDYLISVPDDGMHDGEIAWTRIASMKRRPTAVFVPAGDMVAIGLMKAAKRAGLRIPQDIAVVGFDDLPAAEVIEPALTTVRQPKLEMGDTAIGMVIDKIEKRSPGVTSVELQTKLIVRESA